MILNQIFDSINIGIVILDRDLKIFKWNRWMEAQSGIPESKLTGSSIYDVFPAIKTQKFIRSCKSVFSFGNFCFFSQKLHNYIFPFKSDSYSGSNFEYMQQSCAMGPIRDENNEIRYLFIYVHDVTEVAIYQQKLLEMNWKDGLTCIYNRKYLEKKLDEEFDRNRRYSHPFSMIMFDIDCFKQVNDKYGHQCGDYILKGVSLKISSIIRAVDCLARYGGEEFCCLLPDTGFNDALLVAERFRTAIQDEEYNFEGKVIKITISLGVAEQDDTMDSPDMMLKKADDALYQAKRNGRNRIEAMVRPGN